MSISVQRRRGTTAEHSTFTGAAGELTVDTDKKTVVVHDGSTAGGHPLAHEAAKTKGICFYFAGDVAVDDEISLVAPMDLTVDSVLLNAGTAPTGAALIVDILKNGTTLYSAVTKPTIADAATSGTGATPDVTSVSAGDRITAKVTQVGSTTAGADLAASVVCEVA